MQKLNCRQLKWTCSGFLHFFFSSFSDPNHSNGGHMESKASGSPSLKHIHTGSKWTWSSLLLFTLRLCDFNQHQTITSPVLFSPRFFILQKQKEPKQPQLFFCFILCSSRQLYCKLGFPARGDVFFQPRLLTHHCTAPRRSKGLQNSPSTFQACDRLRVKMFWIRFELQPLNTPVKAN